MWAWLTKWGWLILSAILAAIAYIYTRRSPLVTVAVEKKRLEAEAEVRRLQAQNQYDAAIDLIHKEYATEKQALSDDELEHARELAGDPIALARFLSQVRLER